MRISQRCVLPSCACLLVLVFTSTAARAQAPAPNEWTWMGGSNVSGGGGAVGPPGIYGTLGRPAPTNFPGIRWGAADWIDSSGNFWLFGGHGVDAVGYYGWLNDLWEFSPATGEWTWMGGSSTLQEGASCEGYDCGNDDVAGTLGTPAPGNIPGGRSNAASWIDKSGNLWLFGGWGANWWVGGGGDQELNDLWVYSPSTNEWAWMGGNAATDFYANQTFPGVYGTLGAPAPGNIPGGRSNAASWTDKSGNFWLFGGWGFDLAGVATGPLNDLWEFNPTTELWTWVSGNSTFPTSTTASCADYNLCGVYGTLGTPAADNVPGGREGATVWIDGSGNLWVFGGFGIDSSGGEGYLNDLWEMDTSVNPPQWAWMGGSSTIPWGCPILNFSVQTYYPCGTPGAYGTLGVPSADNIPGARFAAANWIDSTGNFWLFGGFGFDATETETDWGYLNDLWELNTSTNPPQWTWVGGSSTLPAACSGVNQTYACGQPGVYGTLGTPGALNAPGSRDGASSWIDKSGSLWLFGGFGGGVSGDGGHLNDLWVFQSTLGALPAFAPNISPASGIYAAGQTVTISDVIPGTSIYYTTDGTTPTTASTPYNGAITVNATETIEATAAASGYSNSAVSSATYTMGPQTATPAFNPVGGKYTSTQTVSISDATMGAIIYYTTDGTTPTTGSTVYSGPITVSSSETIQAVATASGYATSAVATAGYTVAPPPGFSIIGVAVSVAPGATTGNTSTITLTPTGGFTGTIYLGCAITPTASSDPATCNIPATVTITGSAAQTTTLTVNTTPASSALNRTRKFLQPLVGGTALACILLFGVPGRRWEWWTVLGVLILLFFIVGGALACGNGGGDTGGGSGGGSGNSGTTPGVYKITVTGASGVITETETVSLTVQ
ncbi:MAG: chitobiase/beta-hexosaminidase C-terminal domain-containing protein [Terracidiphilus sp.]